MTITLNVLYINNGEFFTGIEKNISCRCFEVQHEKQITDYCIFLMIPNEVGWHYITVKKRSAFLRRVTWQHNYEFYFLNFPHSFWTKQKRVEIRGRDHCHYTGKYRVASNNI